MPLNKNAKNEGFFSEVILKRMLVLKYHLVVLLYIYDFRNLIRFFCKCIVLFCCVNICMLMCLSVILDNAGTLQHPQSDSACATLRRNPFLFSVFYIVLKVVKKGFLLADITYHLSLHLQITQLVQSRMTLPYISITKLTLKVLFAECIF